MIGELTAEEINALLFDEVVGRIGCYADGRVYVVPITYVFDGESIYAHSAEGLKVAMMRANPRVCVQVDQREDLANWRSVIAWGVYEELESQAALDALQLFVARLLPAAASERLSPPRGSAFPATPLRTDPPKTVIYRIRLVEKTGRFERR